MGYSMSFPDAIKTCLHKYGNISGRACRSEYWYFVLFKFLFFSTLYFFALVASYVYSLDLSTPFWVVYIGAALALLVPSITVMIRRLHDTGRSGWHYFWCFIPIVGSIVVFVLLAQDSVPTPNQWGPDPKARNFFIKEHMQ